MEDICIKNNNQTYPTINKWNLDAHKSKRKQIKNIWMKLLRKIFGPVKNFLTQNCMRTFQEFKDIYEG